MDPHIIDLITKIGAPGGVGALLVLLVYILWNVYQDFKKVQADRIEDAKKSNEALLDHIAKDSETFAKVADAIDKMSVSTDRATDKILNEIEKLNTTVEDVEELVKDLKDKG